MRKILNSELNRVSPEEYKMMKKLPIVVVAENIRSLHNIGSLFRTADSFGIEKICLCGISATPPNREIHKTALGAELSVEWSYFESAIECVNSLKECGYTIISVEQIEESFKLNEYKPIAGKKYALVVGNEVKGVSQDVVDLSDEAIEIPQIGTKHSLNVSVAAGVVLWHFFNELPH